MRPSLAAFENSSIRENKRNASNFVIRLAGVRSLPR
jgi:hypothetical protein